MSELGPPVEEAAEAVVETRSRPSAVWLVPLVAALIGAFLVYRTLSEAGPTITIHFATAEGLEAGKTQIRFKDVQVGLVQAIELSDDLSHVEVRADMVNDSEDYLTENTRFWVVRARVAAGRVTGLGTLFSGAYIAIDPSTEGEGRREFVGLEIPPVVTSEAHGAHFDLISDEGGSFQVGAPVYFRHVHVGEIVSSRLDESGDHVAVGIFVRDPHADRVHTGTRFWNASGVDVSLGTEGVRVDSPALTSILIGGIAFDDPETLEDDDPPPEGYVFPLFRNREEAFARSFALKRRFLLHIDHSVEGLRRGAPVVFQGIRIGEVLDVKLLFHPDTLEFEVPVLIEIEPERIESTRDLPPDEDGGVETMSHLVEKGLRARLKSGNLLTGAKEIELAMVPKAAPAEIILGGDYPEIPTVPTPLEEITAHLAALAERLGKIPLEDIGANLDTSLARLSTTLENTESLTARLDDEVLPNIAAVANDANELLRSDAPLRTELRKLLVELNETARSARLLVEYLERNPESLIRGREE